MAHNGLVVSPTRTNLSQHVRAIMLKNPPIPDLPLTVLPVSIPEYAPVIRDNPAFPLSPKDFGGFISMLLKIWRGSFGMLKIVS